MAPFLKHSFDRPLHDILPLALGIKSQFFSMEHKASFFGTTYFFSLISTLCPIHHHPHLHPHHQTSHQVLGVVYALGTILGMFHMLSHLYANSPIRWG